MNFMNKIEEKTKETGEGILESWNPSRHQDIRDIKERGTST